jgi:hypothetical protein
MQPGECRCVPSVRLDALAGLARDQARRDHHTAVATITEVPVDPVTTRSGLISKAQDPTAPAKPGHQLVECRRLVGDLPHKPHLAISASLRHTNGDRRLVHVQSDKTDILSHGPSPVLRQGAGLPGATLDNPAQFEADHPALYLSLASRRCAGEADDGREPASAWGVRARV